MAAMIRVAMITFVIVTDVIVTVATVVFLNTAVTTATWLPLLLTIKYRLTTDSYN